MSDLDDAHAALRIQEERVHILIDLNGHSKGGRPGILLRRPTPVSVTFLGYPSTSGGAVDLIVTDRHAAPPEFRVRPRPEPLGPRPSALCCCGVPSRIPLGVAAVTSRVWGLLYVLHAQYGACPSHCRCLHVSLTCLCLLSNLATPPPWQAQFSERFLLMPHSYFVNDYRHLHPRPLARAADDEGQAGCGRARCFTDAAGAPHGGAVLANFGQMYKIQPDLFLAWCRALRAHANASLWLLKFPEQAAPLMADNFARRCSRRAHQLVLSDLLPLDRHLAVKAMASLALDTRNFNGHTTSADTLWAGVPVLSLPGDRMPVR
jgi:predicted O-linked N-acetylglucosamine transferase (SPINDLY family)